MNNNFQNPGPFGTTQALNNPFSIGQGQSRPAQLSNPFATTPTSQYQPNPFTSQGFPGQAGFNQQTGTPHSIATPRGTAAVSQSPFTVNRPNQPGQYQPASTNPFAAAGNQGSGLLNNPGYNTVGGQHQTTQSFLAPTSQSPFQTSSNNPFQTPNTTSPFQITSQAANIQAHNTQSNPFQASSIHQATTQPFQIPIAQQFQAQTTQQFQAPTSQQFQVPTQQLQAPNSQQFLTSFSTQAPSPSSFQMPQSFQVHSSPQNTYKTTTSPQAPPTQAGFFNSQPGVNPSTIASDTHKISKDLEDSKKNLISKKRIQDLFTEWKSELEQQAQDFKKISDKSISVEKAAYDCQKEVLLLRDVVDNVKNDNKTLNETIDLILSEQNDLSGAIDVIDKEIDKTLAQINQNKPLTYEDKENIYKAADQVNSDITELEKEIHKISRNINDTFETETHNGVDLEIILDTFLETLDWIETNASNVTSRIENLKKEYRIEV